MPSATPTPPTPAPHDAVLQVARTMDGTLLEVHHVDPAAPAQPAPRGRLLAAAGVVCLLLSLAAFARGVSVAAQNQRAFLQLTEVERRPAGEFRPRRLSPLYDLFALGGLAAGIACLGAALVARRAPRRRSRLEIGESAAADLAWEGVERADLVSPGAAGPRILVPAGCAATRLCLGADGVHEAEEVSGAVSLGASERLRIERGATALAIEWIARPRSGQLAAAAGLDSRALGYLGGSALAFALLLALIWRIPPDGRRFSMDEVGSDARLVAMTRQPREDELLERQRERGAGEGEKQPSAKLASAGEKGTMGTPESSAEHGKMNVKKRSDDVTMASLEDMQNRVTHMGALGVIRANSQRFASLTSTSPFASGLDDRDIYGGIDGDAGAIHGTWGAWGSDASFSNSPYAADWGTVNVGKLPGGAGDTGEDYGLDGTGGGPGRRHKKTLPPPIVKVSPGRCSVAGCDKDTIRRAIKRHLARFRYCYERSLLRRPELSGTVMTSFVISPEGKVQGSSASGIGDDELEGCVANVMASIKFPRISGGIPASVKYPFRFYPAGQ